MSVEIKCDRCGKPIEPLSDAGAYSSRVSSGSFEILRNGKLKPYDLCDDCLWKFDIFLTGRMPAFDYKPDELAYLELPNPNLCVHERRTVTGLEREVDISANLEPLTKLIEGHGVAYAPLSSVKQVILGVKLQ